MSAIFYFLNLGYKLGAKWIFLKPSQGLTMFPAKKGILCHPERGM
jgi:hypothetical protein